MKPRFTGDRRGAVLIAVLALGALAAALAMEMAYQARVESGRVVFDRDWNQADLLARDGIRIAGRMIDAEESLPNPGPLLSGELVPVTTEEGRVEVRVTEESGRYPLNHLFDSEGLLDIDKKRMLSRLVFILEGSEQVVDRIVDYCDADDDPNPQGAESFEYGRLDPPRRPANRIPMTLEEIREIHGMEEDPELSAGLLASSRLWGGPKVNVNSAPPPVLAALSPGISIIDAEKAAARARELRFESVAAFADYLELDESEKAEVDRRAVASGPLYRVETKGVVGAVEVRLTSIIERGDSGWKVLHLEPATSPAAAPEGEVGRK